MTFLRVLPPAAPLAEVRSAVDAALAGGQPVAPLPADPVEADRVRVMLQPDRPVTEPDAAVIVSTSGSTGEPKGVVLSRSAIAASASATHERLGGPGHWLLALPPHYVAGFMVVARAAVAGMGVSEVGRDLAGLAGVVARIDGPSYLSLVPTQLTRALADPALTDALRRVSTVLLGGAPARPELLSRAAAAGVRVVTTYGMSETCGGCVYDGIPLPTTTLALHQPAEGSLNPRNLRRVGTPAGEGRILLGGPMVFSGYRLRPDLTEATLIDQVVRTNDRGRLVDGRLQVLGRFDDVIISGGLKIDTAAVERAAAQWPRLTGEIALVGVPDPEWGSRLVAYAEGPAELDTQELRDFLAGRVARHELPVALITLPRLPRTSSGKIDRESLRRRADPAPTADNN